MIEFAIFLLIFLIYLSTYLW